MSRKIDALVAEHVMGLELTKDPVFKGPHYNHKGNSYPVVTYSEDISAAWEVVEKMKDEMPHIDVSWDGEQWEVDIMNGDREHTWGGLAVAETAPMAIALASLKAVGVDIDKARDGSDQGITKTKR